MDKYFKIPKALSDESQTIEKNNKKSPLYMPGDMNEPILKEDNYINHPETNNTISNAPIDSINDYLSSIVSGEMYEEECELGTLCAEGSMLVSLEKLQAMVEDGSYNIIKAEYFNPEMINIVYQQYTKNMTMGFR